MIPRSSKTKKFVLGVFLICLLLKWRSNVANRGRKKNILGLPTPLLEQPVDREFNSKRVWVSIGLCYRWNVTHTKNQSYKWCVTFKLVRECQTYIYACICIMLWLITVLLNTQAALWHSSSVSGCLTLENSRRRQCYRKGGFKSKLVI